MIYRVLGDVEIGGDRWLPLPAGHHLLVLATLLVNANRRVSKAHLLRTGWGGAPVGEPQLPKAVMALRDLLARIGRRDDIVTHPGVGYEFRAAEHDLDMLQFRRYVRQAGEARAASSADAEIAHLRDALALWRGPHPFAGVPRDLFDQHLRVLEQQRKRAAARLFDLETARGGDERILDELILIAGDYPADQRLCEQLMTVLHRLGHAADAVDAYQRYARALEEHSGGRPDALLRDYQYAISGDDAAAVTAAEAALARRAGSAGRVVAGAPAVPRQLPPEPVDFVGRDSLVAEASWLLGRAPARTPPVLVVSGAGGMGKTALARLVAHRVARHYPDGQLYAELRGTVGAPVGTGEVLRQFLRAFGLPVVPESHAERLALYRTLLAARRVLVVLDDAADEAQIRDLVPAGPGCGVIVTARRRLPEIAGVHHVAPLEPLDRSSATALFRRVVRSGGVDVAAEADAVHRVVDLCGGLPLALRIAGALRVRDHPRPTAELADRLARQGPEGFRYGEESVARTIGAGYDRLDDRARLLFLRLGTLRTPTFALWTAAALVGGDAGAALSELAAASMLDVVEGRVRYRFHDLTRDYALRRARAEGHDDGPAAAYRALLTLARRAHAALYGGPFEVVHSDVPDLQLPPEALAEVDAGPLDWFEKERLTLRAAVEHSAALGLTGLCWDLAVSAHEFYTVRQHLGDWHATHTVALRACRDAGDRRGEGIVLACLGQSALVAGASGDGVPGVEELRHAVRLLHASGDRHGLAIARRTLANAMRRRADPAGALRLLRDALDDYTAVGDTVGRWQSLRLCGQSLLELGETAAALAELRRADAVVAGMGNRRLLAQNRYWIAQACLAAGDVDGARTALGTVLAAYPGPNGLGHAYALQGLGDLARHVGEWAEAESRLARADTLAVEARDAVLEGRVCLSKAAVDAALGRRDEQAAALHRAVRRFAGCGAADLEVRALAELARAQSAWGELAAAEATRDRLRRRYADLGLAPG